MHSLTAYSLGFSAKSRAGRLREKIIRQVRNDAREGLPTRLPFLKAYLCGQDTPWSVPVKPVVLKEGTVLRIQSAFPPSRYGAFLDRIRAFNRSSMLSGIQAVPHEMSGAKPVAFIVCHCQTEMIGDMILTKVPEPFSKAPGLGDGMYSLELHQAFIFMDTKCTRAHECEHAVHYNIAHMVWLPLIHLQPYDAEYLSTMVELMHFEDPMILLRESGSIWMPMAVAPDLMPHPEPLFNFARQLVERYGMRVDHIAQGAAYNADCPEYAAHRETMLRSASREYGRAYEHAFGLPLSAIKEIIAGIQL